MKDYIICFVAQTSYLAKFLVLDVLPNVLSFNRIARFFQVQCLNKDSKKNLWKLQINHTNLFGCG